jgi:tetratricopeptide (TPR) repeat protein
VLLEDQGKPDEATTAYERAVRADPQLADAHYNLALLYERAGRDRDAVRHLAILPPPVAPPLMAARGSWPPPAFRAC